MELEIMFNADGEEDYARIGAPCKGYFTDFVVQIQQKEAEEYYKYMVIGKDIPVTMDFIDTLGQSVVLPDARKNLILLELVNTIQPFAVHRFMSKKRIYINDEAEELMIYVKGDGSGNSMICGIQATFVPLPGEIVKIRKRIVGDGDTQYTDLMNNSVIVPVDGDLIGVKVEGYAEESADEQSIYEGAVFHFDQERYTGFDDHSFTNAEGDVLKYDEEDDIDSYQRLSSHHICDVSAIIGDPAADVASHSKISGGATVDRRVSLGDILLYRENALDGEGTIVNSRVIVTYFIKVRKSHRQDFLEEHVTLIPQDAGEFNYTVEDYFIDHGYVG
jgi:hypothetical protein